MKQLIKKSKGAMVRGRAGVVAGVLAMSAGLANAVVDTAAVTTAITDAGAAVAVVGAAVLVVIVGTRVFKWVARAL